jgi:hypothetical protein
VPQERRHHDGHEQDVDQDVVEVLQDADDEMLLHRLGETIGSIRLEASSRLRRAQALAVRVELGEHVIDGDGMGRPACN